MTDAQVLRRAPGGGPVLVACAALVAPLAVWFPLGLAPLFATGAVAVLLLERGAIWNAARPLLPLAFLFGALAAWATLSAAWSILPEHSLLEGLRLFLIFAGGVVVLAATRLLALEERRRIALAATFGLAVAMGLLLIESSTDGALSLMLLHKQAALAGFDRAAGVVVLSFWPVLMLGAVARWFERALLSLAALATVFTLASAGAALAFVIGFAVFALARVWPRAVAAAMIAGLVAIAAGLPLATPSDRTVLALRDEAPWIKWSGIHRLLIWRFAADRIAERPLGWGMDASRALPGGKTRFATLFPEAHLLENAEALPLHPHSATLQWQVELGIPGSLLCLAAVAWGVWRMATLDAPRRMRAGALAWAASALVIALLAYGAWQAWWLASLFLTAALYGSAIPPPSGPAAEIPAGGAGIPARDRP